MTSISSKFGFCLIAAGAIMTLMACKNHERKVYFGNLTDGRC